MPKKKRKRSDIRRKYARLKALAERPGSEAEGINAQTRIKELEERYRWLTRKPRRKREERSDPWYDFCARAGQPPIRSSYDPSTDPFVCQPKANPVYFDPFTGRYYAGHQHTPVRVPRYGGWTIHTPWNPWSRR